MKKAQSWPKGDTIAVKGDADGLPWLERKP